MDADQDKEEYSSYDGVFWLYVIYGILHLVAFAFDYFLWTSKFNVSGFEPLCIT